MKLLIITSIKECKHVVAEIFRETGIQVFSVSEISGFRAGAPESIEQNWFGSSGDAFDSLMLFSFTEKEKAEAALKLIRVYNESEPSDFPVRGFILPVESFGV